jgi:hypothetical protein
LTLPVMRIAVLPTCWVERSAWRSRSTLSRACYSPLMSFEAQKKDREC